jgi:hypothetical protein
MAKHVNKEPAAREPDMGFEFIDQLIAYPYSRESLSKQIYFYLIVFIMPVLFCIAVAAKLARWSYRFCNFAYIHLSSSGHSSRKKRPRKNY